MIANNSPAILGTGHMEVLAAPRPHPKLGLCVHCVNLWNACYSSTGVWIIFLKQQKCILSVFEVRSPKLRCQLGHTPSEGWSGESIHCLFQLLVALNIPWLGTTSLQSLPSSSCHLLFCKFQCSLCLFFIGIHMAPFKIHPDNPE